MQFCNVENTLHMTHLLRLLDKMCKYEMDSASIVEDTEPTWFCPQTDGQTDWQMDRQDETSIHVYTLQLRCVRGVHKNNQVHCTYLYNTREYDICIWHDNHDALLSAQNNYWYNFIIIIIHFRIINSICIPFYMLQCNWMAGYMWWKTNWTWCMIDGPSACNCPLKTLIYLDYNTSFKCDEQNRTFHKLIFP